MSGVRRFEHARLRTPDLGVAERFYVDVMGLAVLGRDDDTVYLGAGADDNFDLALTEGGTGVEHFALRVDSVSVLDRYERVATDAGLETERSAGTGPGEAERVAVELITGHRNGICDRRRPSVTTTPPAPASAGWVRWTCSTRTTSTSARPSYGCLSSQLRDVFGMRVSDFIAPAGEADEWLAAWTRLGVFHHDVAILHDADSAHTPCTISHGAARASTTSSSAATGSRVPGSAWSWASVRHPVGANIYAYFWDPSGNPH